jgi:Nuclease-related domain
MEKLGTRTKANSYRNKSIIFLIVGAFLFFGGFVYGLLFVFGIVSFFIGFYLWNKQHTWGIGAEGEESVIDVLQELDSSFKVFNDIVLPGDRQNIDHIVVGSVGTFVIETKNHNGIIKCYEDNWSGEKVGRRGTVYAANIGNPSKQAKRNAVVLKNWLQSENIDVGYIVAVVVFTNDDVELKLVKPTVKIVHIDNLLDLFKGETNSKMTSEKINSVAEKLYQLK